MPDPAASSYDVIRGSDGARGTVDREIGSLAAREGWRCDGTPTMMR
jgi:hypothetical protein